MSMCFRVMFTVTFKAQITVLKYALNMNGNHIYTFTIHTDMDVCQSKGRASPHASVFNLFVENEHIIPYISDRRPFLPGCK